MIGALVQQLKCLKQKKLFKLETRQPDPTIKSRLSRHTTAYFFYPLYVINSNSFELSNSISTYNAKYNKVLKINATNRNQYIECISRYFHYMLKCVSCAHLVFFIDLVTLLPVPYSCAVLSLIFMARCGHVLTLEKNHSFLLFWLLQLVTKTSRIIQKHFSCSFLTTS